MVKVIAGRDKDKEGKVIAVNKKTTHSSLKALTWLPSMQSQAWQTSRAESFIRKGPIDASNVMFLHKGKATRVGFKMDGDKKVRYAKSTGDVID